MTYRQTSNISHILVGDKIVDHSYVIGASPADAAPTTSSFSTQHPASMDWAKMTKMRSETFKCQDLVGSNIRDLTVLQNKTNSTGNLNNIAKTVSFALLEALLLT